MNAKTKSYVRVRKICVAAMMIAAEVVLNRFCSIKTAGWNIGFSFVPVVLTALVYGPGMAAVVGGLSDFIGAILFPIGVYHPGFTIIAALMGFNDGIFLHGTDVHWQLGQNEMRFAVRWNKIGFWQMLIPTLWNHLVLGLCVNTAWVSMLYGSKTYWGWFLYRLPQQAIMIPVTMLLLPVLTRIADLVRPRLTGER